MGMLNGIRVLECAELIAGPFCGKLLASLGASVIKIEPPGTGDPSRAHGPFPDDLPDPERSGLYLYLNGGKRSLTLDVGAPEARPALERLVAGTDLLIQDESPSAPGRHGHDYEALAAANPSLVVLSIVTFGSPGPYAGYKAYPLNLFHAGTEASVLPGGGSAGGSPDRPPVAPRPPVSEYDAGWTAAVAAMGALFAARAAGRGEHVEVSKFEAMANLGRIRLAAWMGDQALQNRWTNRYPGAGTFACSDGFIQVLPAGGEHWRALLEVAGLSTMLDDGRFDFQKRQFSSEDAQEIYGRVASRLAAMPRERVYRELGRRGVPVGLFSTVRDVYESPQHAARGFFQEVDHAEIGPVRLPLMPFQVTGEQITLASAPRLGADTDAVLEEAGCAPAEIAALRRGGAV